MIEKLVSKMCYDDGCYRLLRTSVPRQGLREGLGQVRSGQVRSGRLERIVIHGCGRAWEVLCARDVGGGVRRRAGGGWGIDGNVSVLLF